MTVKINSIGKVRKDSILDRFERLLKMLEIVMRYGGVNR